MGLTRLIAHLVACNSKGEAGDEGAGGDDVKAGETKTLVETRAMEPPRTLETRTRALLPRALGREDEGEAACRSRSSTRARPAARDKADEGAATRAGERGRG
jgi:hypothetical protein